MTKLQATEKIALASQAKVTPAPPLLFAIGFEHDMLN